MTDWPARVRRIRAALTLSQEKLAEGLGVSFATVNRWENGKSVPQRAHREALDKLNSTASGTLVGELSRIEKGPRLPRGIPGPTRYYLIEDGQLRALQQSAKRLYTEERLNGDEMRDMAHRLTAIVRVCEELPLPDDNG